MDKTKVQSEVMGIVAEQMGVDVSTLKPETTFVGDLGIDSLDGVELTMEIEEAFGIEIPDEETTELDTIAKVVDAVNSKLEPDDSDDEDDDEDEDLDDDEEDEDE